MHPAVAIALLALGVAAIVTPRPAFLSWAGPPVLALLAIGVGAIGPDAAGSAVRPLAAPVAFVVFAVPFAVLLDRAGLFTGLSELLGADRGRLGSLWVLAGLVVALLNLDAAVVLLTPLYLRLAVRRGESAVTLAFQPLLLSCLASSALPISNLTNLIADSVLRLSTTGFLVHLAAPTLAASAAGFVAYRRLGGRLSDLDPPRPPAGLRAAAPGARAATGGPSRRAVAGLGTLVVLVVAGFLVAPALGGEPWQVAAAGDAVLVVGLRTLPLASVPWRVVLTALGLGVLASAAAGPLHVDALVSGGGAAGLVRDVGLGAAGANLFNNLPALLVALPALGHHVRASTWSFLLGDNIGPLVLPSGSLAGLLWLETMRRLGAPVTERAYLRLGWRVGLPALVAATGALLLVQLALGRH